jgi:hypothetical protein
MTFSPFRCTSSRRRRRENLLYAPRPFLLHFNTPSAFCTSIRLFIQPMKSNFYRRTFLCFGAVVVAVRANNGHAADDHRILRSIRGGSSQPGTSRWSASSSLRPPPKRGSQPQHYPITKDLDEDRDRDTLSTKEVIDAFLTRDSRNTFIARVYGILSGQLIVTAISVLAFGLNPSLGMWMKDAGSFGTCAVRHRKEQCRVLESQTN